MNLTPTTQQREDAKLVVFTWEYRYALAFYDGDRAKADAWLNRVYAQASLTPILNALNRKVVLQPTPRNLESSDGDQDTKSH